MDPSEKYKMQSGPDWDVICEIVVLHAVKQIVAAREYQIHLLDVSG